MKRLPDELIASLRERIGRPLNPATDEAIAIAEKVLGRSLPSDLRQIYELSDGGWGPGDGIRPLTESVENYRGLCSEPFGPLGQPWPEELFPLYEEERVPVSYDLSSSKVLAWEADRIEDLDDAGQFEGSFIEEAGSLAELLTSWLASETFEQVRDRVWRETLAKMADRPLSPVTGNPMQFDDPVEQVQAEIQLLSFSAEVRALYGMPETDWEAEIWRRHGLRPPM
jgi:hypothetical protein